MRHHYTSASPTDSSHWGTSVNPDCGLVLLQISGSEGDQCRLAMVAADALRFAHSLHDTAAAPTGTMLPLVREDITEGISPLGGGTGPRPWWSILRDNAGATVVHFENSLGEAGQIHLTPAQATEFAASAEADARMLQPATQDVDADSTRISGMLSAYSVVAAAPSVTPATMQLYEDMGWSVPGGAAP